MNPPAPGQSPGAMRPASRRAMLDAWLPGGTEGPLCPVPSVLLGIWSFSKNKEAARACWFTCRNRHRLRSSWQRAAATTCRRSRSHHPEDLGEEGRRRGRCSLSESVQSPEIVDRPRRRRRQRSPADLRAGHPDKNVPEILSGEAMEKTLAWAEGELKATCGADEEFAAMARRLAAGPLRRASAMTLWATRSGAAMRILSSGNTRSL